MKYRDNKIIFRRDLHSGLVIPMGEGPFEWSEFILDVVDRLYWLVASPA
jgi:hypothetical protein